MPLELLHFHKVQSTHVVGLRDPMDLIIRTLCSEYRKQQKSQESKVPHPIPHTSYMVYHQRSPRLIQNPIVILHPVQHLVARRSSVLLYSMPISNKVVEV